MGKQALALYAKADRMIFNNCRFLGLQDTLRSESGRHYFYNSYVEGTVDFIYGKGTAYFENSTLYPKSGGYLTAQARESDSETSGYVFQNATITGSAANGSVYLGRPWAPYSRVVFLDSKMGPAINPAGWSTWSGDDHLTTFYAEYNSMDLNGEPLDVSQRVSWSYQLSAVEAEAFSKENWLDGWEPDLHPDAVGVIGDYNGDEYVDAADYTVWRDAAAAGATTLLYRDPANTGPVDEDDYLSWREHFGQSLNPAGSGSSAQGVVPEPASISLVSICLLMLMWRRRTHFGS